VKLNKKFAFAKEDFRRENIKKDGKRIGVYFLGLAKTDGIINKEDVFEKHQSVFNKFDVNIDYVNQ
jgi:UDP-4-amino-4,6-dideoxy-N-acetyl-beta-L-altrosamine N-acetyltransferase